MFRRREEPDVSAAPVPLTKSADPRSNLEPPDERRAHVTHTERASGSSDYFTIPRSVLERWRRAEA
jgi:hypothetical protein